MNENNLNNSGNIYNVPPQPTDNINTPPVQNEQYNTFQEQPVGQPVYNDQPQNNYEQPIDNKNGNKKKILLVVIAIVVIVVAVVVLKNFIGGGTGDKKIDSLFSSDTPIRVQKDKKYGFIDSNGNFIIQPQYEYATDFYGNYAAVELEKEVEGNKYQIIDKKGNVKAATRFSSDIEYIDDYDVWIINDQLYNGSLNKITADGIRVDYEKYGYLSWIDDSNKKAGIMTTSGKVTYTYKFANGEDYLGVDPSETDKSLKERYCRITIENEKYAIVNCDTGKVVYDYTDKYISVKDDNIFEESTKDNYDFVSIMYIQNDKIIYQSYSKNVDLYYYSGYGYVQIRDDDKDYSERYSYIDISTGKITNTQPSSSSDTVNLDEWEEFSKLTKFSCSNGYGLMSGKDVKIPCEWSSIEYFDLLLYKYLSSKGKEYVLAEKDDKTYLLNLKDGKSVAEFNSTYIHTYYDSSFIYYTDSETNKRTIYNLITGKSITDEGKAYINLYSNYITLEENNKLNYYNMDLKLIYTEE